MVNFLVKEGDFVRLEYEGYDEDGNLFDSTNGDAAKELRGKEGPILIVLGKDQLVKGLNDAVMKMNKGEEKEVELLPKEAFGERKKEMLKILPETEFRKQNINPVPGLQIHMDTSFGRLMGTIKSVTSGRILVDFNHSLAGKKIKYKVKLVDVVTDTKEKVDSLIERMELKGTCEIKDGEATLKLSKDEKDYEPRKSMLFNLIKTLIPEIKNVKAE